MIALNLQILLLPISLRPAHASNLNFGSTLNLSQDSTSSDGPIVATAGSNVYVAWSNNNSLGNPEVFFARSNNNGSSFHPAVKLSNTPTGASANPQIAAIGKNVFVVWQGSNATNPYDILLRSSNDNGTTFTGIKNLSNDAGNSVQPVIAVSGINIYVAFQDDVNGPSPSTDIFFSKSNNTAQSFFTQVNLSNDKHAILPQMAATGNSVYIAWRDQSSPPDEIYLKRSPNAGVSFSAPSAGINLSNSPTATSLLQQIAATGTDVYVVWYDDTPSTDDVFAAVSTDGGSNFANPVNLSNNANSLNPSIAAAGPSVYVAWENHAVTAVTTASLRISSNNGQTFQSALSFGSPTGFAQYPQIAAVGSNVYLTWQDNTGADDIFFASSSDNGSSFGSTVNLSNNIGASTIPIASGSGDYGYVAWKDDTPGNDEIFFKAGTTVAPPDAAVSAIVPSRIVAYSGVTASPVIVNVTAANPGSVMVSFVVSVKANGTFIASNQTVTNLAPGASVLVQFSWNTASLAIGKYLLIAYASQVTPPGETNLSNNNLSWSGSFTAKLKGDVSSDCKVDIVDLALVGSTFGKTFGQPGYNAAADLNNDGTINIVDLVLVSGSFGQQITPCPY